MHAITPVFDLPALPHGLSDGVQDSKQAVARIRQAALFVAFSISISASSYVWSNVDISAIIFACYEVNSIAYRLRPPIDPLRLSQLQASINEKRRIRRSAWVQRAKIVNQREKSFSRMLTALPGFTIGLKYAYLTDRQGASQDVKNHL